MAGPTCGQSSRILRDARRWSARCARQRSRIDSPGCPTETVLLQRLQQCCDRVRTDPAFCFAVIFLDFDRFKLVNDTLGHEAGDALLIAMGQRLNHELTATGADNDPCGSFAARFGGDEFVYVAAGIDGVNEARVVADRLQSSLSVPYQLTNQAFESSTSIGIAMGDIIAGGPQELLRNADTAMYEAKRLGRGNTVLFDVTMHDRLTRALRIEAALAPGTGAPGIRAALPAHRRPQQRQHDLRGGTVEVGPSRNGQTVPGRVHPDCGRDRPDHSDRGVGVAGILPAVGVLAARKSAPRARERERQPVAANRWCSATSCCLPYAIRWIGPPCPVAPCSSN